MDSRREFLRKAGLLAGGIGLSGGLEASVQRAFAIDPGPGSTYLDAEHIVILMQENRSFDHCYGTLQGVRGFNDPRTMVQPNGNKVWMQSNAAGETYLPFRLNIKETRSAWTGALPHSRASQVDARNGGRYDKWLIAKASGNKAYANAPLTMGYYNREDLPFYYALADAFTICDQNFSSSLTGTTPNRLYLWTGNVRGTKDPNAHASLTNADVRYDAEANWTTFPERLEDNDISWKIYQNEISLPSGFNEEEDAWLANFTDNPIEWFTQYNVRFSKGYRNYLQRMMAVLPGQISVLETTVKIASGDAAAIAKPSKELQAKKELFEKVSKEKDIWTEANFKKLSAREQRLHKRAFSVNSDDPFYRELETLRYMDGEEERSVKLPKGDVLHQFRKDVEKGQLPAVSWLVAPENFSDHPDAPWYGAWYVSEAMDILTHNPEVWKKTIFILCYDENDGYFDHIPPFVPDDPNKTGTGFASKGVDTALENVTALNNKLKPQKDSRTGAIGLGFRVPLVIASPWSRGGAVCSQVFDHTSVLQLMEKIFSHKTGKKIREENITSWRRAVCGDLTAVFGTHDDKSNPLKFFLEQHKVIEAIHKAKFKKDPSGYKSLTAQEVEVINRNPAESAWMPRQEPGIRRACPIAYQLYADGHLNAGRNAFELQLEAGKEIFGDAAAGSPFVVYAPGKHTVLTAGKEAMYETGRSWNYTVAAGDQLEDQWPLNRFEKNIYDLSLHGPNGFFRTFMGDANDPDISTRFEYERSAINKKKLTGDILLSITNNSRNHSYNVLVTDNAYKKKNIKAVCGPAGSLTGKIRIKLLARGTFGWYDFTLTINGNILFSKRYAGHVETGSASYTDPFMGDIL